jgi:hypothetical protein
MADQETCKQCGGLLYVDWIMTLKQGSPHAVRWEPGHLQEKFCPGHPMVSDTEAWAKLNNEQKYAVQQLREWEREFLIAKTEQFYKEHPEIRLSWSVTIDATLRSETEEPTTL